MKKLSFVGALTLFVTACANYTLVEPGAHSLKGMTVSAGAPWNQAPSVAAPGKLTTWTADGLRLNQVQFFVAIEDGKPLYKASKKAQFPVFSSDMLPNEIVEAFEATISKASGSSLASAENLRPREFGGLPGFEFDYRYIGGDDVERKGFAAGTVKDGKLYMITYEAAALYFYDQDVAEARRIVDTAQFN